MTCICIYVCMCRSDGWILRRFVAVKTARDTWVNSGLDRGWILGSFSGLISPENRSKSLNILETTLINRPKSTQNSWTQWQLLNRSTACQAAYIYIYINESLWYKCVCVMHLCVLLAWLCVICVMCAMCAMCYALCAMLLCSVMCAIMCMPSMAIGVCVLYIYIYADLACSIHATETFPFAVLAQLPL